MNRRHPSAILIQLMITAINVCHSVAAADVIVVDPGELRLREPRDSWQLLVERTDAAGTVSDETTAAAYESLTPSVVSVTSDGFVQAVDQGQGQIRVTVGPQEQLVHVTVQNADRERPFDFENDVTPYLTRFGCNMAACHAKAGGQNGLQFSVFGYDIRADFEAIVCSSRGRRVSRTAPAQSLFLLKATQTIPHGGGRRLTTDSDAYQTLLQWVKSGAPYRDEQAPRISRLQITPQLRQIRQQATQQLRVTAIFSDGSEKDVTRLARYRSNNEGLGTVDEYGRLQTRSAPGQVAVMATWLGAVDTFRAYVPQESTVHPYPELPESNVVDRLVHQNLRKLQLVPSGPVSDADFLRRVYLDIIGTLPTAQEARTFLTNTDENRRARLVDKLLERPEYASFQALRWSDRLRVDRDVLGHRQAYAYYRWIRDSFASNRPLDAFARAIITADGPLDESPQGGFYRAVTKPGDRAAALTQVFLGIRMDCAECHHHPFDRWSQQDYYGMTAFFTGVTSHESAAGDSLVMEPAMQTIHPRTGEPVPARPLGFAGDMAHDDGDPRAQLAEWLTADNNPWFARNLANRTWAHFFGRGLVEPVDDVRDTNPSTNSELLSELAAHLRSSNYDIKSLIRLLTASQAYQRTAQPNPTNESDTRNASRSLLRPLAAEVLLDAVSQTTGIPAQFDGAASGTRAIELWDSKLQHPFLRLFGRPERKTACDCERVGEPSVSQVLHIMNSPDIYARLDHQAGTVSDLVRRIPNDGELTEELYLTFLSRFPTESERQVVEEYFREPQTSRRSAAVDLAWSLMNSLEFSFNH